MSDDVELGQQVASVRREPDEIAPVEFGHSNGATEIVLRGRAGNSSLLASPVDSGREVEDAGHDNDRQQLGKEHGKKCQKDEEYLDHLPDSIPSWRDGLTSAKLSKEGMPAVVWRLALSICFSDPSPRQLV